jgi:hypothetical protein
MCFNFHHNYYYNKYKDELKDYFYRIYSKEIGHDGVDNIYGFQYDTIKKCTDQIIKKHINKILVYDINMGRGKSSILIPGIVLNTIIECLKLNKKKIIIIIYPEHI